MTESSSGDLSSQRNDFICGVVEGFYGRPWTTEQRKDLFQKLKKWNMDMYVYAPKDDYKHRAYWRELYTVEEAEHLTSLITAAKDQGIVFCYALSPGLDITYSNQKEITALKRKLEQVSQFGCTCFALLFDDIEPEMSEADKQIFQSFAHAQVSVTNEIHQHLGCPRFLLCPTQYCSTRAVPTVNSSEYLNTLGSKLSQQIDIMWTGPKVISKELTPECIEEITQVLRRPPVIWDNLHANDYDQKRIFLGPYCGRSAALIPLLRGVLTNPNCEYHANLVAIRTLGHWAHCTRDAPPHMDSVSWDIKLERESEQGVCEDEVPPALDKHVYHHRQALRMAISEWLPEFDIPKTAQGPMIKPQPPVAPPVTILPIVPSINTCMSLTSTSTTTSVAAIPTVHTAALATAVSPVETINPVSNPVMNSLVSPTKVILNESIPNPIVPSNLVIPSEIPISTLPVPILGLKPLQMNQEIEKHSELSNDSVASDSIIESPSILIDEKRDMGDDDNIIIDDVKDDGMQNGGMSIGGTPSRLSPSHDLSEIEPLDLDTPGTNNDVNMFDAVSENGSMQVEPSNSPLSTDMMIEQVDPTSDVDVADTIEEPPPVNLLTTLTVDDLILLCDLFYLPFEHGARGLRLLHDFNWLVSKAKPGKRPGNNSESAEWRRRRCRFAYWCSKTRRLLRLLTAAANKELSAELRPYLWELCSVLALLDGFVGWLQIGKFPPNIAANTQGSYTWFSKGWREAFESGNQEPWVFRGGLTADLRRLLPVESTTETITVPPNGMPMLVRPYTPADEDAIREICHKTFNDGADCTSLFPSDLQRLPADSLVTPYLMLSPEFCMVIEDDNDLFDLDAENGGQGTDDSDTDRKKILGQKSEIIGFVCATLNWVEFNRKQELAWLPEMREKYPETLLQRDDLTHEAKEVVRALHSPITDSPPTRVSRTHPARVMCGVRASAASAGVRLMTCVRAALRAYGVNGVHVSLCPSERGLRALYLQLGLTELAAEGGRLYLGKTF